MLLKITHHTHYHYSEPIKLGHHRIRLKPASLPYQTVTNFQLHLEPKPTHLFENIALTDSIEHEVWFDTVTDHLKITTTAIVQNTQTNPYYFIIYPFHTLLPHPYTKAEEQSLQQYLQPMSEDYHIDRLAKELLLVSDFQIVKFISTLTQQINQSYKKIYRRVGAPYSPEETLQRGKGACRDLAYLHMAICRKAGLASRFVSGYLYVDNPKRKPELHAWVEVYIPGGGWRGFDPTTGLAVTNHHVYLTSAHTHELCMPIEGVFTGKAKSKLDTNLQIEKLL
jgi:transglutaminase-like putative cysteine protease